MLKYKPEFLIMKKKKKKKERGICLMKNAWLIYINISSEKGTL